MKLTILTDDKKTYNNELLCEHGLCYYIECDGKKILFDTGYSDVFLKNAKTMGLNLLDLDYIALSHGHYDHTGGLSHYLKHYLSAIKKGKEAKKPTIIAHPDAFLEKLEIGYGKIGSPISEDTLRKNFELKTTKEPFHISENLIFLGEILRNNDFEAKEPIDKIFKDGKYEDDYVLDDSALVYDSGADLTIITGCSHSGICNIVEYAKQVCKKEEIKTIIGGFHLINAAKDKMAKITNYLSCQNLQALYPCHCTDSGAKQELANCMDSKEIGVGFQLET